MLIITNTKNYKYGNDLLKLAKQIQKYLPKSIIAVPTTEVYSVAHSKATKLKVFAQHIGFSDANGRSTGYVTPESIKQSGASGTILNHSEHPMKFEDIKKTITDCKKIKLQTLVCVKNNSEAQKLIAMSPNPTFIAYEDPKLVSSGKSITQYRATEILKFVKLLKNSKIIPVCGAGISDENDIQAAKIL